jgi:hypothetical protein
MTAICETCSRPYWMSQCSPCTSTLDPVLVGVLMAAHLLETEQSLWTHDEHHHEDEEDGHLR